MHVFAYVYVFAYILVYVYMNVHRVIYTRMCLRTHTCMSAFLFYIYFYINIYRYMYVGMYVCMYMCAFWILYVCTRAVATGRLSKRCRATGYLPLGAFRRTFHLQSVQRTPFPPQCHLTTRLCSWKAALEEVAGRKRVVSSDFGATARCGGRVGAHTWGKRLGQAGRLSARCGSFQRLVLPPDLRFNGTAPSAKMTPVVSSSGAPVRFLRRAFLGFLSPFDAVFPT